MASLRAPMRLRAIAATLLATITTLVTAGIAFAGTGPGPWP